MELDKTARLLFFISVLARWVWIASIVVTLLLILWEITGNGEWYYPVISIAIGYFFKELAREYLKESEKTYRELTDIGYAAEQERKSKKKFFRFFWFFFEVLSGLIGWLWIASIVVTPLLILWAIFGNGEWYYPVISMMIGGFSKSLTRKCVTASQESYWVSTGIDYAAEWMELSKEDKENIVIESFRNIYRPKTDMDSMIENYKEEKYFDSIINGITRVYEKSGLKKPYQVVCSTFIERWIREMDKRDGYTKLAQIDKTGLAVYTFIGSNMKNQVLNGVFNGQ